MAGNADQDAPIYVQSDDWERDGTSSEPSESSESSADSAETVGSSDCDLQEPDAAPVVVAPDLAAVLASPNVAQVVLDDIHAPLVTIKLDELALAPALPLLRVPYLERLLEAVRSGTPANGLAEAMRPAARQAHDDLATYLTELVLGLFDGALLRSLQGPLEPFQALVDPITVRRALLSQMRYVADVASSLPRAAYSTSGGLFRLAWRATNWHALTLRLRTVYLFVPQPVAACLRAPPPLPVLIKVTLPEHPHSPCTYLAAMWKMDVPHTPSAGFVRR